MKNDLIKIQSAFLQYAISTQALNSFQFGTATFLLHRQWRYATQKEFRKVFFFQFSKLMIYKCKSLPLPGKIDQTVFLSFFGEMRINGAVCLHHGVFNSGTQNQLFHCVKVTVKKSDCFFNTIISLQLRLNVVLRMALIFRRVLCIVKVQ